MVQINWTFQAKDDLKNIAEYISKDSAKYAQLQISRIKLRTQIIKKQIYAGKITPEINDPNIRELVEGNYRIIYRLKAENSISILTVHHSARDFNTTKGSFK